MRSFDPASPLLRSVDFAIQASGGPANRVFRSRGQELLAVSLFLKLQHGRLKFHPDECVWEQEVEILEEEHMMLHISENGNLRLGPGDDDIIWIKTSLKAGDELDEFIEFYSSARATLIGTSTANSKPLSQLIEDVFLLVSQTEGTPRLLPLRGQLLSRNQPKVAEFVEAWLTDNWDAILNHDEADFGAFLDKNSLRDVLGTTEELHLGDLILTGSGVHYAGMLMAGAESDLGHAPALVLRPKAETSRMWLIDYLEHAAEAKGLVERMCQSWRQLPKGMNEIMVAAPSAKRDQVASAIERRNSRLVYLAYLKSAMLIREPFNQIASTYKKRTIAAQGLNTELLDDLVAIQQPLPFFLEYPYRQFRREDDHIRKVRAAQRLLGILAKVPLFLVIEELLAAKNPIGRDMLLKVEERPLSDGSLVALHKELAKRLAEQEQPNLRLFNGLLRLIEDTRRLDAMVAARNRMHHEPFDEEGFLEAVNVGAPRVIDSLREALRECRFLVPQHGKVTGSGKLVVVEDVCAADAHFRRFELEVTLPLESFPSDTLIAWRQTPEFTLVLGRLVTSKLVTHQSRDFGVFDRMQKDERHFTFLRSE